MNGIKINKRLLNPLGFHLLRYLQDASFRQIILYGGSSSGKTYSISQAILIMNFFDGENTLVMRKVGASITKTIYEDFKVASRQLGLYDHLKFKDGLRQIVNVQSGAKIDFGGLDDPEKIKGISNYKRVVMDEWSEFDHDDYKQIRKRLRGKHGQQIIASFNPIKETHWIKKEVMDKEQLTDAPMEVMLGGRLVPEDLTKVKSLRINSAKSILNPRTKEMEEHAPDMVVIQSTYLNNFWVVGSPDGTYGYYDQQCIADFEKDRLLDPDYYNVYALGEWGVLRTGSEFFGSFNRATHTSEVTHDPSLPIHISVDANVLPYITVTMWQVDTTDGHHVRQIDEVLASSPNNTVRKSAILTAKRLKEYSVDKVFLHGDASTRSSNVFDDEKRSFLDLFIQTLNQEGIEVTDCVGKQNPSVSLTGEFMNAIFERIIPSLSITIGENCVKSIEDYSSVQKDVNGAILKTKVKNKTTGQTYEEHGHISDTARYFIFDILREHYMAFTNRRKRSLYAKDGAINFFNPATQCVYTRDIVYAMPNINGKFAYVYGKMCGDKWHIIDAKVTETASTDEVKSELNAIKASQNVIECSSVYYRFVRELREELSQVKVMPEVADFDRRITATSDFVKNHILFNETALNESSEYAQFMANLLDYRKGSDVKEASVVLSGFMQYVVQFDFDE